MHKTGPPACERRGPVSADYDHQRFRLLCCALVPRVDPHLRIFVVAVQAIARVLIGSRSGRHLAAAAPGGTSGDACRGCRADMRPSGWLAVRLTILACGWLALAAPGVAASGGSLGGSADLDWWEPQESIEAGFDTRKLLAKKTVKKKKASKCGRELPCTIQAAHTLLKSELTLSCDSTNT